MKAILVLVPIKLFVQKIAAYKISQRRTRKIEEDLSDHHIRGLGMHVMLGHLVCKLLQSCLRTNLLLMNITQKNRNSVLGVPFYYFCI